jgi:hypothetical protein
MTAELAEACARASHVACADGTVLHGGRGVLFVAAELGWRRSAAFLSLPPLIWLVELGYAVVIRNRPFFSHFLFRKE